MLRAIALLLAIIIANSYGGLWAVVSVAMLIAVVWYGRATYRALVSAVTIGRPYRAAFMVLCSSAIPLVLLAKYGENRDITTFLDLSHMPWSLTLGDPFVLPALFAVAALQARPASRSEEVERERFYQTQWYTVVCAVFGIACGITFHLLDAAAYARMGYTSLVYSVAKLIHDLVVMPLLVAAVARVAPVALARQGWLRWLFGVLFLMMVTLLSIDAFVRTLDPSYFHVDCNVKCVAGNLSGNLDWFPTNWVVDRMVDLKIIR